jgi:SpoVK/Ycf46/Vps4 family AAA+-type ATPase
LRSLNKDPPALYGDVKNYIQTEILGNAAQIKSFCIIGPEKCGKKFLVEALCSEMGAVMFDLSAAKIKDVEDVPHFLDVVLQVAAKFQPSVLFIDGAHKPFIRKASDEVRLENPWKLGRHLYTNVVKNLTSEDAVMLIGVTSEPWNCNFRSLRVCYEKFAVFPPKLDHGTAVKAWQTGLRMKRILNLDVSALAEVSRVFTVGDILDVIDKHIDFEREILQVLIGARI